MKRTKAEAAETRAAILVAAEKLFFEKGISGTTLDAIAAAAGVTRGAIYWHFESKNDLFLQLYDSVNFPKLTILDLDDEEQTGDALALIEKKAVGWLESLSVDLHQQRMLSILFRTNFTGEIDQVNETVRAKEQEQEAALLELFQRARRDGSLNSAWPPEAARDNLKWLLKGMTWEWLRLTQKYELPNRGGISIRRLIASFR